MASRAPPCAPAGAAPATSSATPKETRSRRRPRPATASWPRPAISPAIAPSPRLAFPRPAVPPFTAPPVWEHVSCRPGSATPPRRAAPWTIGDSPWAPSSLARVRPVERARRYTTGRGSPDPGPRPGDDSAPVHGDCIECIWPAVRTRQQPGGTWAGDLLVLLFLLLRAPGTAACAIDNAASSSTDGVRPQLTTGTPTHPRRYAPDYLHQNLRERPAAADHREQNRRGVQSRPRRARCALPVDLRRWHLDLRRRHHGTGAQRDASLRASGPLPVMAEKSIPSGAAT